MNTPLILILFLGFGLPVLAFLSGVYYVKKNQGREERINRVVTQIIDGPQAADGLLSGLLTSGILDLESGKEIVEACDRIEAKGGKNPIPDNSGLSLEDLKPFFAYVFVHKIYLSNATIQKAIKTYRDKMRLTEAA